MSNVIPEIEKTPLWYEILDVLTKCDQNTQAHWTITFFLNDKGDLYEPLALNQLTLERDYTGGFCDLLGVTVSIPYGKYVQRIYKNRNTLRAVLTRYPLYERSTTINWNKVTASEEYTVILKEPQGAIRQLQGDEVKDEYALDLRGMLDVQFQLFSKVDERIRITTVGGIYRYTNVEELSKYLITSTTAQYKIPTELKLKGVDMIASDNKKNQTQIIIPHGMPLFDVPGFLQKTYGVYNAGLGSYIQSKQWFIYPLFDTNRFFDTKRTFTLYILPKKKFSEIERTYRVLGTDMSIITTSHTDFTGDTNRQQLQKGDGVRFTDGDKIMDGFGKAKSNRYKVDRKQNNFEFKTKTNLTTLDYAPVADTRITSNPFVSYSDLALRKGGIFTVLWENSRPNILEPGMPCRVVYFDQNRIKEAYGIILSLNHVVEKIGDYHMKKHSANSRLQIFTNMKIDSQ